MLELKKFIDWEEKKKKTFVIPYQWKESDDTVLLVTDDVSGEFLFRWICVR